MQQSVTDQIIALAGQHPNIEVLWLYGSQAKGNAEADSDYDLAVAFSDRQSLPDYYGEQLASEWAQKTGQAISVVDINTIPTPLAVAVIYDGIVLLSANDLRLRAEEQRVWSLWEEYEYEFKRLNS